MVLILVLAGCGKAGEGEGRGPRDAAAESSYEVALAPGRACTPGQDQTCNDLSTMSALAGRCENNGDCLCNPGFSYNWNTGRCRAGTACTASAGDLWPDKVPLAVNDCGARPAATCLPAATDDAAILATISDLVRRECDFPSYTYLRVELAGGCATLFELSPDPSGAPGLVPCLERVFSSTRWECAGAPACVLVEWGETL
jgi:hypothetical protein